MAPHRVRKNDKFYGRNSAGRYPLDVGELRAAFTLSETVAERVRSFRADRLAKVYGGETPVAVRDGGRMVLHVLPLSAFTNQEALDLSNYYQHRLHLPPMGSSGWDHLINLDGFVTYTSGREHGSRAYTQLFRTGAVEAVSQVPANDGAMFIPSTGYEEETACFLATYAKAAYGLGVEPPCYVFLSFLGVRGCRFGVGRGWMLAHEPPPLREDTLLLPEVVLEDRDFEPHRVLRPVFDMVWNAFGFERSLNYDDDGNWAPR